VYIVLKSCGYVREAKGHNGVFEVPVTRSESYLLLISFLDTNSVVRILDINLAKDLST
jgi:hypothetical protein